MIKGVNYAKYCIDNEADGRIVKVDAGFTTVTGYTWEDVNSNDMTIFHLIPDSSREEYIKILYRAQEVGEAYLNHEILRKDGSIISVNCYGEVYNDADTGRSYSKILIIDVTEQEKAVHELKEKEEQLAIQIEKMKILTEDAQEIFIDYDKEKDSFELSHFNGGEYEILSVRENYFEEAMNTIPVEDFDKIRQAFSNIDEDKGRHVIDFRSKLFYGRYIWYRMIYAKYINPKTGNEHIIGRITDINDEKTEALMEQNEIQLDAMTALYNRSATERKVNDLIELDNEKYNYSMLLINVDYFKKISNLFGYHEAAEILKKIRDILLNMFRQDFDIIGRIGGDEMVVFLKNMADVLYLETKCKEICHRVRKECILRDGKTAVTVSVGVALADKKSNTFEKMYEKADKAVQRQVKKGRDGYSF